MVRQRIWAGVIVGQNWELRASMGRTGRILIVEDDAEDYAVCVRAFAKDPEFAGAAVQCETWEDALAYLRGVGAFSDPAPGRPDLILLDHMLADVDGREALQEIKADEALRAIPVVMLTGMGSEALAAEAIRLGASDYLSKDGLTADLLVKTVRQALNRDEVERRLTEQEKALRQFGRLEALGPLAGGIAHDFNNLLASILYAVDLAAKEQQTPRGRDLLHQAVTSIQQGKELAGRLLAFAEDQPQPCEPLQISQVLDDFETLARPVMRPGVSLVIEPSDEGLLALCERGQLERALLNLVTNSRDAILAASQTGTVRIETSADTASVRLTVADDGPGMSEEVLRRASDPFFTTKADRSGSGLGLPMVSAFARQSSGTMLIESKPGEGARVTLSLPRAAPGALADGSVRVAKPPVTPPVAARKAAKAQTPASVLLVEDRLELLVSISNSLTDLGYSVSGHIRGDDAMEAIVQGEPFALLLTDVSLPGEIDGLDLAKAVRARHRERPIILMSGFVDVDQREIAELGAAYLRKPLTVQDVAEALSLALARGSPHLAS
jgi:signal transduction histidine kinase